jgi:hypothetical protein
MTRETTLSLTGPALSEAVAERVMRWQACTRPPWSNAVAAPGKTPRRTGI